VAALDQALRHEGDLALGSAVTERVEDERGVHGLDTRVRSMGDTGTTTVVVITRDRPERLRSCIERLGLQDAGELLVVDDGSEDRAAVAGAARRAGARLVRQERAGVASARNTGAAHANGSFVLFTDDDCAPVPGWAATLSARLAAGADVVAGPTRAARPERALDCAWQLIADELVEWHGAGRGFLPGSNFGARADALAALPFDVRFDGVGAEDRDWWARVHRARMSVAYVPDAAVDHAPDLGLARFARKQVTYGRGAYRYRATHHDGRIGSASFYRRLIGAAAQRGPRVTALVTLAQVAAAAGFASEGIRQRRDRRASPSPAPRRPRR
jgi:glycosyltransferase involved in cell wall biosynthesis